MQKILNVTIGFVVVFLFVYLIGINIVNVAYFGILEWTFDFNLLFFNNQNNYFYILSLIAVIVWSNIVYVQFFNRKSKAKNKLSKADLKRASHSATMKETKRYLLRIRFDKEKIIFTIHDRWDVFCSNNIYRRMIELEKWLKSTMKVDNSKKIFILSNFNHKHPISKKYSINGKETYKRAGLPVITYKNEAWVNGGDEHSLIIGTSGSGKSWSLVLQYIELCRLAGENILVNDPKGELALATKDKLKQSGYEVIILNFVNPEYSSGWNPLEQAKNEWIKAEEYFNDNLKKFNEDMELLIAKYDSLGLDLPDEIIAKEPKRPDYSKAVELLYDVANTLCLEPNSKDPIWSNTARNMVVGAACFILEDVKLRNNLNFSNIKRLIESDSNHLRAYMIKHRNPEDTSVKVLEGYLVSQDSTKSSFDTTFQDKIAPVTQNEGIERILANNHVDFNSLGDKKTAIFLVIHDEKKTYHSLATMFVKQAYEALIRCARKSDNLRLKIPMNFILDEFGNMPALKDVDTMLTAARSRGIRITMIVQDLQQLNEKYGKDVATTIKGNVMLTAYLLSGANETLKEVSELAGKQWNYNKDKKAWELTPCFTVDRLKHFQQGEALFLFQRRHPYYTKLLGYDEFVFYDSQTNSDFDAVPKQDVRFVNFKAMLTPNRIKGSTKTRAKEIRND